MNIFTIHGKHDVVSAADTPFKADRKMGTHARAADWRWISWVFLLLYWTSTLPSLVIATSSVASVEPTPSMTITLTSTSSDSRLNTPVSSLISGSPGSATIGTSSSDEPTSFPTTTMQSTTSRDASVTPTMSTSQVADSDTIAESTSVLVVPSSSPITPTPVPALTCVDNSSLCQDNEMCNATSEECDCLTGYGRDTNMTCTVLQSAVPSVISWSLDLDVGNLTLEIANSETLNVSAINCSAIQIVGQLMDANRSGIECGSSPLLSGNSLTISLNFTDRYRLSVDSSIATNVSDTFLVIDQEIGIFNDAGDLLPISPSSPLQTATVIPDTTAPLLLSFNLDLNVGLLILEFSEPVSVLRPSAFTLWSAPTGNGTSYTLIGGELLSEPSAVSLQVFLTFQDLNTIKALTDLATSSVDTFLSFTPNLTTDYASNEVSPILSSAAIQATSIISDSTTPQLISFSLDLNAAELRLTFDETVNASSFEPTRVTLVNSTDEGSGSFTLTSGDVSAVSHTELLVSLSQEDFNRVSLDTQLAVSFNTTYLDLADGAVFDTSGNPSSPVFGLSPVSFTPDTTPPELLMFTLNLGLSKLMLHFSEVVDKFTINAIAITIQSGPVDMTTINYTLTGGLVTGSGSPVVNVTLDEIDVAELVALPTLATEPNNTYISFLSSLVEDYNGNPVVGISPEYPLQALSVPALTCVMISSLCQDNEMCNVTSEECDCLTGYGRDSNMTCTVINDFAPVFADSQNQSIALPSLLDEGWLVILLNATDMDILGSNVTYHLEETGDHNSFQLDEVTGELTLNSSLPEGNYTICVLARDGGGKDSDPLYINIEVFTVQQPQLTIGAGTVTFKETLAVNSSVFNVTCSLGVNSSSVELLLLADTNGGPFQLQSQFGIGTVILLDDLDQSSSTRNYSLTITCINTAFENEFNVTTSDSMTVNVIVEDVPEVWIAFTSSSYSANITENTKIGDIIALPLEIRKYTRLQNARFENGTLLTSSSVNLTVAGLEPYLLFHAVNWSVAVLRNIDRESFTVPLLILNVSAQLVNTTGDFAVVSISILDVNDNRPVLSRLVFAGNATTRTSTAEEILTIQASDADDGDNAAIQFSLDNTTYFTINQSSGVIQAKRSLPPGEFLLTVTAADSGTPRLSSESTVAITVFQDLVAHFDNGTYFLSVLESRPPGSMVGSVAIAITQHVVEEPIYSIVSGNGSETFHIGEFSGKLVTLTNLDRETDSFFHVHVSIMVGSSNATADVFVTVLDTNDNSPEFEEPYYHFTLQCREQEDIFGIEYQVSASDKDVGRNAKVMYSILPLDNVTINSTTGVITPLICLSEEDHVFTVTATDGGSMSLSGDAVVVVSVIPALPDHLILEQGQSANFSLLENNIFGSPIGSIKVTNIPDSLVSRVEYTLLGNDSNFFQIDEGELRATSRFDRELRNLFTFQAVAVLSDGNTTSSGNVTVVVHVLDENDNDPHFEESFYSPRIQGPIERLTAVLTVTAMDADLDRNGEIIYSIEGPDSSLFTINKTGTISAQNLLDVGVYQLVAVAMDGGSTPRTDRVTVVVHVLHADPVGLECVQTPFNFSVADGTAANHFVGVIQVNASNGVPLPSLEYQTESAYFYVDVSGFLFTNASVDLDSQLISMYNVSVNVSATTSTGAIISVLCPVSVSVTSINDNPPVLTNLPNSIVIEEELASGTSVFKVTASDNDTDAQLQFRLLTFQTLFEMDSSSGEITVKARIDREDGDTQFELAVVVSDGKVTSEPRILNVTIADINDYTPMLVRPLVQTIDERCCVSEAVFNITVSDPDFGSNGEVVVTLESHSTLFRIEHTTVYLLQELDFEEISSYNITINLRDNGKPTLNQYDIIEIVVLDKPDNPPVFGLEPGGVEVYYVPIAPNISAGAIVFHLMAFDPDLNRVSYNIVQVDGSEEGNFTKDDFEIGVDSGIIRKVRKGNFTSDQNVTIVVEATDDSVYNVQTNVSVLLFTVPQNLTFVQSMYQFTVTENAMLSDSNCTDMYLLEIVDVSRARVIDFTPVNSTYSTVAFHLLPVQDDSQLAKGAGVCPQQALDHEDVQMITLLVRGNSATGTAFVSVQITVEDVNDNPPIVTSDSTMLSEDERNVKGYSIANFTVTDADSGVNGEYRLTIQPLDAPVEIIPRGTHYSIQLTESLNFEAQSAYTFTVVATDTGDPPMSGSLTFDLSVVDINDPPVLDAEIYVAFAKEPITTGEGSGIVILTVTTTDEDAGSSGLLSRVVVNGINNLDVIEESSTAVISLGEDFMSYTAADQYVEGTITAEDYNKDIDMSTLYLVIVPQSAVVVLLVGSRLSPSLFMDGQEAVNLKMALEDAIDATQYEYALYSVERSGTEELLKVSGVFYRGPCNPEGPCPDFLPFRYDFMDANTTEVTINSKAGDIQAIFGISVNVFNQPATTPHTTSPPSTTPTSGIDSQILIAAGIAVAAIGLAIAIFIVALIFFCRGKRREKNKDQSEQADSNWGFRTKPVGQDNIPMHRLKEDDLDAAARLLADDDDMLGKNIQMPWWDPNYVRPDKKQNVDDTPLKRATVDGDHRKQRSSITPSEDTNSDMDNYLSTYKDTSTEISHLGGSPRPSEYELFAQGKGNFTGPVRPPMAEIQWK